MSIARSALFVACIVVMILSVSSVEHVNIIFMHAPLRQIVILRDWHRNAFLEGIAVEGICRVGIGLMKGRSRNGYRLRYQIESGQPVRLTVGIDRI